MCRKACFVMRYHPHDKIGGAETQAWMVAKAIASRGWEVHYLCESLAPRAPVAEDGVTVRRMPLHRRDLAVLWTAQLYQHLAAVDAEVYYQRIALPHTGLVARFCLAHDRAFVWASSHTEDCTGDKFTAHAMHSPTWRGRLGLPIAFLNDWLVRYGQRRAHALVTQTRDQAESLKRHLGLSSVTIPNGHPEPESVLLKQNPPLVVWVANLNRWKRPRLFVALARACQDIPAQFVMVGKCADGRLEAELAQLTQEMPQFAYQGEVDPDAVNDLIARATLLVNTSLAEGFPNTFIQSWLRGTPVLSLTVNPDSVITREGIGVCSGTFDQLVHDLRKLLQQPEICLHMGERGRRYALREHSLDNTVDLYEALFTRVLEDKTAI